MKPQPTTRPKPVRGPSYVSGSQNIGRAAPHWGGPSWYTRPPTAGAATAPGVAAAGPAAVAPVAPAGLPVDPVYEQAIASLARRKGDSVASLGQQRFQGLGEYGYTESPGGLQVNTADPYSRASLLQRAHDQSRLGNTTSMASRGQLYSGALTNAQDATDQGFQQNSDSLQKQLINFLARNTQGVGNAQRAYEEGASQAYAERVARASDNPLYDPAALAAMVAAQDAAGGPPAAAAASPSPAAPKPAARPAGRGLVESPAGRRQTSTQYKPQGRSVPLPRRPRTRAPKIRTGR